MNTEYNQVCIATDHWGRTVNLYVSDYAGQFYVEALPNVLNIKDGYEGGFIADIYEVAFTVICAAICKPTI